MAYLGGWGWGVVLVLFCLGFGGYGGQVLETCKPTLRRKEEKQTSKKEKLYEPQKS